MTGDGREAQVEEGTVLEVLPGPPALARVLLAAGPGCEECGARLICRPDDPGRRSLMALAPSPPPKPGERVRVSVSGARVLSAGLWAYGLPLVGLCAGLGLGWLAFAGWPGRELLASAAGLACGAAPFAFLWWRGRSRPQEAWFEARILARRSGLQTQLPGPQSAPHIKADDPAGARVCRNSAQQAQEGDATGIGDGLNPSDLE